jgi:mRNA-degrading endonuclease RelE of RelBE toxin-antitoxin system
MSYKLTFHPKALKEWGGLDKSIKEQFKKIRAPLKTLDIHNGI